MRFICSQCGYNKEQSEISLDGLSCPVCGAGMQQDFGSQNMHKSEINASSTEEQIIQTGILRDIDINGKGATWLHIEALGDVTERIKYRKMFFALGGTVPHQDLLKNVGEEFLL